MKKQKRRKPETSCPVIDKNKTVTIYCKFCGKPYQTNFPKTFWCGMCPKDKVKKDGI